MPSIEQTLQQSVEELQIRSQVEEAVRELVTDVEVAHQLEHQWQTQRLVESLEHRILQQEQVLEESQAIKAQEKIHQHKLADNLVKELWSLSHEMGTLKDIQEQHQVLLVEHDEVVAKLFQAQEELQQVKRSRAQGMFVEDPDQAARNEEAVHLVEASQQTGAAARESQPTTNARDRENETVTAVENGPSAGEAAVPAEASAPVVVALEEEELDVPRFEELEAPVMMHIFSFMDALDILNTAQVNISMYSRVDSLFGFGNGAGGEDTSTIATVETAPSTVQSATVAATTTTAATTQTNGTAKSPPAPAPSTAAAAADTAANTKKTSAAATTTTSAVSSPPRSSPSSGLDGALNIFSSILQPRRQQGSSSSPGSRHHHKRSLSSEYSSAQPMNAAMANSMAAKLSDSELNAIINMTERLKQKEGLAEQLKKENEELAAKLDGTDAVKQFLIVKVRDMELSIATSEENEAKVAQQIASDQEVIAFLDGRVQELEGETRRLEQEAEKAMLELERVKEQSEKKSEVMADMLQFERERFNESEREWKATKKLLIKEVKNCRAQIVALQAERDGYREQNDRLRKVVLSSPAGPSSSTSPYRDRVYI